MREARKAGVCVAFLVCLAAASGQGVRTAPAVQARVSVAAPDTVQFADQFASIQAAIDDLPAAGGKVVLPPGTYLCGITISKPVILEGAGMGGFADNTSFTTYLAPTELVNRSPTAPCITIMLPASNALGGVILRDFAIKGNKDIAGATAGAGISIRGGTDTTMNLRSVVIENVMVRDARANGIEILDNAYMITLRGAVAYRNAGNGIYAGRTVGTGMPSQLWLDNVISDLNDGDAALFGPGAADVYVSGGTFSNAGGWGINTAAGFSGSVRSFGGHFEGNASGGIQFLGGGGGNLVNGGVFVANHGIAIKVDTETSNYLQSSAVLRDFYSETDAVILTANAKNTVVLPELSSTPITDQGFNTGARTVGRGSFSGGVVLNTTTAPPLCNASVRGMFWMVRGGARVKDTVQVCAKDATDAYAWRRLY